MWTKTSNRKSERPASSKRTRFSGSAERRFARQLPAEPPPRIRKSYGRSISSESAPSASEAPPRVARAATVPCVGPPGGRISTEQISEWVRRRWEPDAEDLLRHRHPRVGDLLEEIPERGVLLQG